MQKDLSQNKIQGKSFIKIIAVSAFLAIIIQLIYEYLSAENSYGEVSPNRSFSIHFGDLFVSTLYEYMICFFITFLFLFGVRFLYFSFASSKTATELP
jgi:hypothetical protein